LAACMLSMQGLRRPHTRNTPPSALTSRERHARLKPCAQRLWVLGMQRHRQPRRRQRHLLLRLLRRCCRRPLEAQQQRGVLACGRGPVVCPVLCVASSAHAAAPRVARLRGAPCKMQALLDTCCRTHSSKSRGPSSVKV
jgi:hypothetical protein